MNISSSSALKVGLFKRLKKWKDYWTDEKLQQVREQLETAAAVGGFDIAAITGAMVACTDLHIPFVIDGYITAVAMACATQMNGEAPLYGIPSHYSREVGMAAALAYANIRLDEVPIHGQMALGEGTGAVLMVQLLKTAHFAFMNIGTMVELLEK